MTDSEVPVEITVHTFRIGDYEDPDLAAGAQLWEWEHSAAGQWVVARSISIPTWYRRMDPSGWDGVMR